MLDFYSLIIQKSDLSDIQQTMMLDDFCARYNFVENLTDLDSPTITKQEFLNKKILEFVEETVNSQRKQIEMASIKINVLVLTKPIDIK